MPQSLVATDRVPEAITKRGKDIDGGLMKGANGLRTRAAANAHDGTAKMIGVEAMPHFVRPFLQNTWGNHATNTRGLGPGDHELNRKGKGRRWGQHEGRTSDPRARGHECTERTWRRDKTEAVRHFALPFFENIGGSQATIGRGPGPGAHDNNRKRKGRGWGARRRRS